MAGCETTIERTLYLYVPGGRMDLCPRPAVAGPFSCLVRLCAVCAAHHPTARGELDGKTKRVKRDERDRVTLESGAATDDRD